MEFEKELETLDSRMKSYENTYNILCIEPYKPYVVRLDGNSFSKFTNGFRKPFDDLFQIAMIQTMNNLVEKFSAQTGYTHSDEITLVFNQCCTKEEYDNKTNKSVHSFNGRIIKLCSVMAGYCSARFNDNINNLLESLLNKDIYTQKVIQKINSNNACFDARIITFPDDKNYEITNLLVWRSIKDCHRNAVSTYARSYYSQKQLHNKNSTEMIQMLKDKGLDWNNVPIYYKHGTYAKKELYTIDDNTVRQRITNKCFKIKCTDEYYNLLMSKTWPEISINKPELINLCIKDNKIEIN